MPSSVNLSYGNVSFSAEGEKEDWLATQLDKVLGVADKLSRHAPAAPNKASPASSVGAGSNATLASHLKSKGAETSQVKRFLVAADWLRVRGQEKMTTAMVVKALKDNHQSRLGNPAACECWERTLRKGRKRILHHSRGAQRACIRMMDASLALAVIPKGLRDDLFSEYRSNHPKLCRAPMVTRGATAQENFVKSSSLSWRVTPVTPIRRALLSRKILSALVGSLKQINIPTEKFSNIDTARSASAL